MCDDSFDSSRKHRRAHFRVLFLSSFFLAPVLVYYSQITPNNNDGSDHGWSQHNMILGGKVKGGQVVGQYPDDITPSSYLDDSSERGRFIPMVSNDAIWNSVLQWFGVTNSADLDVCLPNRLNTVNPVEGTNFPLYERSDLFEDDDRRRRRTLRTSAR